MTNDWQVLAHRPTSSVMNRAERRRQDKIRAKAAKLNEELEHQIAVVEHEIEIATGEQREHYRALLRRLRQVRDMEPVVEGPL